MQIGLIGLPLVGKTTLFNLLCGTERETARFHSGRADTEVGIATVPDKRVDALTAMYKPKKISHAQIHLTEVPGLVRGSSQGAGMGNAFLQAVRNVDALVHVVRAFTNPDVPHVDDTIDPLRDLETIGVELLLADLGVVENRIQRIEEGKKKRGYEEELAALKKCHAGLESGVSIQNIDLTLGERDLLRGFAFLTEKPLLVVANLDEASFQSGEYPGREAVEAWCASKGCPPVPVCGQLEMEISRLSDEDRAAFTADLGLSETGIERLARAAYAHLGLISFLTSGEDEVKAWTIHHGTRAKEAAGKIHSDIERGFIRAEVVAFTDLMAAGSIAAARDKGLLRLEGKEYPVRDGDIINFRFNV